ncbi:MAG: NAD(P)-binding domain-containing protein [Crocinitomicaceae bacterium]|nr:NAD(P)-binding domain-containing protein [Crocinitomicaceae bacterium]
MKKIERIGIVGCGWLGATLAEFYLEKGLVVYGTTRTPSKAEQLTQKGVHMHLLNDFTDDLTWLDSVDILVLNIPPSSLGAEYPCFMAHIVRFIGGKTNVIFISSTSVYDNQNRIVDEKTTEVGDSARGKTVYAAEQELNSLLGTRLTILRMAGLVGNNRHPVKFMTGKNYPGKSEPINLIHLEDCIGLIDAVIENACWGETINGCAGEHPEKGEYYRWAAEKLDLTAPIFTTEKTTFKIISNEKSSNLLGYIYRYNNPFGFPL